MQKKPKVLFLSTGSSTRSQMAAGFLSTLGEGNFDTVSTGIQSSELDPVAAEVMREVGISVADQKPKSVAEALKDYFSYVVILYDAAKERSPIFPFSRNLLHWSLTDPNATAGASSDKTAAFRSARDDIRNKVETFLTETGHQNRMPIAA